MYHDDPDNLYQEEDFDMDGPSHSSHRDDDGEYSFGFGVVNENGEEEEDDIFAVKEDDTLIDDPLLLDDDIDIPLEIEGIPPLDGEEKESEDLL